jgi:hypothetical protein
LQSVPAQQDDCAVERDEDLSLIMRTLMRIDAKADLIIELLDGYEEEEDETDA